MALLTISKELQQALDRRKVFDEDTYEDVIWDLFESQMELSEKTKQSIKRSQKEFRLGKYFSSEEIKRRLSLSKLKESGL